MRLFFMCFSKFHGMARKLGKKFGFAIILLAQAALTFWCLGFNLVEFPAFLPVQVVKLKITIFTSSGGKSASEYLCAWLTTCTHFCSGYRQLCALGQLIAGILSHVVWQPARPGTLISSEDFKDLKWYIPEILDEYTEQNRVKQSLT